MRPPRGRRQADLAAAYGADMLWHPVAGTAGYVVSNGALADVHRSGLQLAVPLALGRALMAGWTVGR